MNLLGTKVLLLVAGLASVLMAEIDKGGVAGVAVAISWNKMTKTTALIDFHNLSIAHNVVW